MEVPRVNHFGLQPRILLIEHDELLSILDTIIGSEYALNLERFGYLVVACENSLKAKEELFQNSNYDLILSEFSPIDSLTLLKIMKKYYRSLSRTKNLQHIPMIIMSANLDDNNMIACLMNGAVDYMLKPVASKTLKSFYQYIRKTRFGQNSYSVIRKINYLANVDLIRRSDNELFTMQTFQIKDRLQQIRDKIALMNQLQCPAILKYHESFIENDEMHIIMDEADYTLEDHIEYFTRNNQQFEQHQILEWIAQLVIAIKSLHDENILHRDIRPENIYLKQNIIKLGGFEQAEALPQDQMFSDKLVGATLYLSPELASETGKYDYRVDIWALGCVMYQLVMLSVPFSGKNKQQLYGNIIQQPHRISQGTDPDFAALIDILLEKDSIKRPTIWTLANHPLIKDKIPQGETINVLLAEDCPFQRIAISDQLQLCGYKVTAFENGILALNELQQSQVYDLIILDLLMPEMDGLALLKIIKSTYFLKNIPVVMISANNENIYLGACLQAGAVDYLIKPLKIKYLKALRDYMNKKSQSLETSNYSIIKNIGKGISGSVDLVIRSTDQELFAMKSIPLQYKSDEEKSQNEVSLLKLLKSSTIIRYYESFTENDQINIIMEYAEGGSLHDLIQQHTINNKKFDKDQILYWVAQLVIAIQFMHNKNILHRDIKTQNMFLKCISQVQLENIIKLGDFGLSKALGVDNFSKTFIGTPYFMSPEVVNNVEYGNKADIWALGCALYELVMLRKPFQHDVMPMVFEMIVKQPHKIDEGTDPDLASIIDMLLQKDPNKRPTIWTLAKLPIIQEKIYQFYRSDYENI